VYVTGLAAVAGTATQIVAATKVAPINEAATRKEFILISFLLCDAGVAIKRRLYQKYY
jgi:hypothetical protein